VREQDRTQKSASGRTGRANVLARFGVGSVPLRDQKQQRSAIIADAHERAWLESDQRRFFVPCPKYAAFNARLRLAEPAPCCVHFPARLDDEYLSSSPASRVIHSGWLGRQGSLPPRTISFDRTYQSQDEARAGGIFHVNDPKERLLEPSLQTRRGER